MSYLLFVHVCLWWCPTRLDYISNMPPVSGEVRTVHRFSFLCYVVFCLSSSCVLCAQCCLCFWIVHSRLSCRFVSNVYVNSSNTTGVASGAGSTYSSRACEVILCFLRGSCCLIFSFHMAIVLPVLKYTASDYYCSFLCHTYTRSKN